MKDAPVPGPSCEQELVGPSQMCAVFNDSDYRPELGAAYYARALENESCRWTTRMCANAGVQCESLDPANGQFPQATGWRGYEGCCRISGEPGLFTGAFRHITQQERAWSSPIWVKAEQ